MPPANSETTSSTSPASMEPSAQSPITRVVSAEYLHCVFADPRDRGARDARGATQATPKTPKPRPMGTRDERSPASFGDLCETPKTCGVCWCGAVPTRNSMALWWVGFFVQSGPVKYCCWLMLTVQPVSPVHRMAWCLSYLFGDKTTCSKCSRAQHSGSRHKQHRIPSTCTEHECLWGCEYVSVIFMERERERETREKGNAATAYIFLFLLPILCKIVCIIAKRHLVIRTSMALRTCWCPPSVLCVNLDAASHAPVQVHTCKQYKRIIKTDEPVLLEGSLPCTTFASSLFMFILWKKQMSVWVTNCHPPEYISAKVWQPLLVKSRLAQWHRNVLSSHAGWHHGSDWSW